MAAITMIVNGAQRPLDVDPDTTLLWVIRDALGLTGTKYGCGIAQCGACTVHVDGEATRSCVTPVGSVAGRKITTIEGLSTDRRRPVSARTSRRSFLRAGAASGAALVIGFRLHGEALAETPDRRERDLRGHGQEGEEAADPARRPGPKRSTEARMNTGQWTAAAAALLLVHAGAVLPAKAASERVERHSTLALSFREGDRTRVDIVGVTPRSGRIGKAEIKRREGRTRIELDVDKSLKNPQSLGSAYTAYVLWAVAPEGRAESLAELPVSRGFDLDATTSLDTFGLIVTAEPYAAVSRPGPLLVAQSGVREDTRAAVRAATVEYVVTPGAVGSARPDLKTPLLLLGARRAVEMARDAGAPEYAAFELREAEGKLSALEQISRGKKKLPKDAEAVARDVMRVADHARVVSLDRADEAAHAAERRAAQSAIGRAQADADRAQAEADEARARADRERQQALDARRDAERAQGEAVDARTRLQQAQIDAERERQQALDARRDLERAEQEVENARTSLQQARTDAERAQANEALARAEADRARAEAQQARQDKQEMEARLYRSISEILETRREARGLIVNLSDVLFDFDRATLTPGAREKLSRLAGILLAYPGPYTIELEGHTDSVGSHGYNQQLSENRARSVASYLREAGITASRIVGVQGFAETRPVATNETAAGRQRNRRVELVIGGLEG